MDWYLRFVCPGWGEGIFQAAYALRSRPGLGNADRKALDEQLTWFERNLQAPDLLVRTRSKGFYRRAPVAICWFRESSRDCIRRAWALVQILRRNDLVVEMVRTHTPGYVTYADEHQVAAIRFSDR